MKRDIKTRGDLYLIVSNFYKNLLHDPDMNHFFEKFHQPENLEHHLQILVDFWDNILFQSNTYRKNAMIPHIELNKDKPFQKSHFEHWLKYFTCAVDDHFAGENAEVIKNRALSIATVMQLKILNF